MMNELLELSKELHRAGVTVPLQHADVGKAKKGKNLVVQIDSEGNPVFYYLTDKSPFFRHSNRNHHAFPIICIGKPLWDPARLLEDIEKSDALNEPLSLNKESDNIKIDKWTKDELEKICQEHEELQNLRALIERFPDTPEKTEKFNRALVKLIQADIAHRPELHAKVKDVFFGKKKDDTRKGNTQIVFDIVESFPGSLPILRPELWEKLASLLRERDLSNEKKKPKNCKGVSHLSGKPMILEEEKAPDPTLPVLGQTFVYTRNKDTKYLERFNLNGFDFHMGKQEINAAVDGLMYILQEEYDGRTWKALPGQKSKDLLIAYVEQQPQDGFADLLGGSTEFYAEIVNRVVEQFRDRSQVKKDQFPPKTPKYTIRLLVLGKIDDARKQVLLNRQYHMAQVIESAQKWQEYFENSPEVDLGNQKLKPLVIYPLDIFDLAQKVWGVRSGNFQNIAQVPSIKLGDLYDLYLPPGGMYGYSELCHRLLDRFVIQGWPLIGYVSHENCRKKLVSSNKKDCTLIDYARRYSGIYTLLLDKINPSREENMKSIPFLLGQFLKAVDILHREYHRVNSPKNPLPPRLLGNSHYQIAFDRPLDAIEMLSQRLPIYIAWADTVQEENVENGEKVGAKEKAEKEAIQTAIKGAKEVQQQLAYIMGQKLFTESAFENWGNEGRAQMMQGYLAKLPVLDQQGQPEKEETEVNT